MPISPLAELDGREFDALVLGGGLTGCAVARALALSGGRVALIEPVDIGWAGSGRTSRLALGELRTPRVPPRMIRTLWHERTALARSARHLARPTPVLDARTAGRGSARAALADALLRLIVRGRGWPGPRDISQRNLRTLFPDVHLAGRGAVRIHFDALVDDRRLALMTALDALRAGATLALRCDVTGLESAGGGRAWAEVRDRLSGETATLRTRAIVNATGAWIDRTRRLFDIGPEAPLFELEHAPRLVAAHAIEAMLLVRQDDGRTATLAPSFDGLVAAGPPERGAAAGIDEPGAACAALRAVLEPLFGGIPPLERTTFVAVRAAARRPGVVREGGPGVPFWSVVSGDPLLHRLTARRVAEWLEATLGPFEGPRITPPGCLPGGDIASLAGEEAAARAAGLTTLQARWMVGRYGSLWREVLREAGTRDELGPADVPLAAEVPWAVRHEGARTLSDLLLRWRLPELPSPEDHDAIAAAAGIALAHALGWSSSRLAREHERWHRERRRAYGGVGEAIEAEPAE